MCTCMCVRSLTMIGFESYSTAMGIQIHKNYQLSKIYSLHRVLYLLVLLSSRTSSPVSTTTTTCQTSTTSSNGGGGTGASNDSMGNSSESSRRYCPCCYCELFGHNGVSLACVHEHVSKDSE